MSNGFQKNVGNFPPLLVGEASNLPLGAPFGGRSGRFLAGLAGLELEGFLGKVEAVNLLDRWPGKGKGIKGDLFPKAEAEASALRLSRRLRGRLVILCGKRVAGAFGIKAEFLERVEAFGAEIWVVPHPSGVVRWYNEAANRRKVGRLLKEVLGCAWKPGRSGKR